jgi:uncharacterized protein (UPF0335 family)
MPHSENLTIDIKLDEGFEDVKADTNPDNDIIIEPAIIKETKEDAPKIEIEDVEVVDAEYLPPLKVKKKRKKKKYVKLSTVNVDDINNEKQKEYFNFAVAFQSLMKSNLEKRRMPTKAVTEATTEWVDEIRLLIENDKYTVKDLRDVYREIRDNEFWWKNAQSVLRLRTKRDGVMKIQNILASARTKNTGTKNGKSGTNILRQAEILMELTNKQQ